MFNNSMPRHGLPCQGVVFTKQLVKGRMRFYLFKESITTQCEGEIFLKEKYNNNVCNP